MDSLEHGHKIFFLTREKAFAGVIISTEIDVDNQVK